VAWPVVARAQRRAMLRVGYISTDAPSGNEANIAAFEQGLKEAGFVKGQTVAIEYLWAEGHYDRLPALMASLVERMAAVLVPVTTPAALAAKAATNAIPIVFRVGSDPVELGLVASLSRPGGNITGVTTISRELLAKRLEILHGLVPDASIIAHLVNPTSPGTEAEIKGDSELRPRWV
jgi:putative tryptophan/tyrosine transport system substrate-binding protein